MENYMYIAWMYKQNDIKVGTGAEVDPNLLLTAYKILHVSPAYTTLTYKLVWIQPNKINISCI